MKKYDIYIAFGSETAATVKITLTNYCSHSIIKLISWL